MCTNIKILGSYGKKEFIIKPYKNYLNKQVYIKLIKFHILYNQSHMLDYSHI